MIIEMIPSFFTTLAISLIATSGLDITHKEKVSITVSNELSAKFSFSAFITFKLGLSLGNVPDIFFLASESMPSLMSIPVRDLTNS